MRFVLALALGLAMSVNGAFAADKTLKDFFGEWVGQGAAKEGGVTTQDRASTVMIERLGDGFEITWSTMRAQIETPAASVVKSTTVKFKGTANAKMFHGVDNGDPFKGGNTAWATLSGDTLRVQLFNVEEDGSWTVQIYDRTLTAPAAMDASFRRVSNGEVVRKAELKLTKSP
jgi:hypothetical protein